MSCSGELTCMRRFFLTTATVASASCWNRLKIGTSRTFAMRRSVSRLGSDSPRSTWLIRPVDRPASSASAVSVRPRTVRSSRIREPSGAVSANFPPLTSLLRKCFTHTIPRLTLMKERLVPFDVAAVRARFGALDGSFAFFDAPGGTQVPDEVGAAVAATMRTASGNTGAVYPASKAVEAVAEEARQLAARFAGSSPDEIIFGANMTTLNFALSRTAGRAWRAGDEILVTRLDHDANVAPWLDLAEDKDLVVRHVDVLPDSSLDMADLRRKLTDRTRVVAFPWAANSLGTVTDARLIAELAHEAGAIAWADAVQYAPHFPMDLPATGVDVVLFSAYKFCGPHLGIAYGRRELLESWIPYKARPAPVSPVGARFQTGSLPIETLGGFSATMRYLDSIGGLPAIVEWERQLAERFLAGLPAGTVLYGRQGLDDRVPIFLLNLPGVPAGDVPVRLAEQGIGVWSGANFYSLGLYERLNWGEAVRVGIAHYNTLGEVDQLTAALTALCGPRRLSAGDRFPIELLPRELSGPAVVYFYPKDDTETCTRQAIEFSRQAPLFEAGGVDLFGVSVDSA